MVNGAKTDDGHALLLRLVEVTGAVFGGLRPGAPLVLGSIPASGGGELADCWHAGLGFRSQRPALGIRSEIRSGMVGTMGMLAALHEREGTGVADGPLFDSQRTLLMHLAAIYVWTRRVQRQVGAGIPEIGSPYGSSPRAGSPVVMAVLGDRIVRILRQTLGLEELGRDPKQVMNVGRVADRDRVVPATEGVLQ